MDRMKKLFVFALCLMSFSVLAQNHMFEFSGDHSLLGDLTFNQSKVKGHAKSENLHGELNLNFARAISSKVQVGIQSGYARNVYFENDAENYYFLAGAIYNFSSDDFTNSIYASFFTGWDWRVREEMFKTKFSFGKRIPLSFINDLLTYSPEVSFIASNPTKKNRDEWAQDFVIRFLQFAVFF